MLKTIETVQTIKLMTAQYALGVMDVIMGIDASSEDDEYRAGYGYQYEAEQKADGVRNED